MLRGATVVAVLINVVALSSPKWSPHVGVTFNTSGSVPKGLYRHLPREPRVGDLVLACAPPEFASVARARGYIGQGACEGSEPLVKRVAAIAAPHTAAMELRGLRVEGSLVPASSPRAEDSSGRPLKPFEGTSKNPFWLLGEHPRSFDSRYFGPVSREQIRTVLEPVWTWR